MQSSIAPFLFSLLLLQRLISFSKINDNQQWVKWFNYARFFAVFLFMAGVIQSASETIRWIWHIFMVLLLVFAFQQNKMRSLRMFLMAFAPYVAVALITDLSRVIASDFFARWERYFSNAVMLAIIWLIAILFSQYRQNKAAEKERIKRQKEDEINRLIAIRKVELEGMVAERTAELTQQKEELENTLEELKSAQSQLIQSEKMASLGELTAGIAHEIQNPLNFVTNFSEVTRELIGEMNDELALGNLQLAKEIAGDIEQNLQKINHHGKRAGDIVKGMLQHSRTSSGVKELTDINALADEYLRLAYHGLRAKDKSFHADYKLEADTSLPKIEVVPQDIGRVFLNLINNAFYAVSERNKKGEPGYAPAVSVTTKLTANGQVLVAIKDNGPGIPANIVDKIFQPFFTTKPTGQGTGLGLSLSYDIVKAHGGELKVETKEGFGSEFIIHLPFN